MASGYLYPDSDVLVNKLGIRDQALLDAAERQATRTRLAGLKLSDKQLYETSAVGRVHQHLFQDLYTWAGQQRTVNISKSSTAFLSASQIEMGLQEVVRQLRSNAPLADLTGFRGPVKEGSRDATQEVAARLAGPVAELNFVHPFRDGNGRTTRAYIDQIVQRAGLRFDAGRLDRESWMRASIQSAADPTHIKLLEEQISGALVPAERSRAPRSPARSTLMRTRDRSTEEDRER